MHTPSAERYRLLEELSLRQTEGEERKSERRLNWIACLRVTFCAPLQPSPKQKYHRHLCIVVCMCACFSFNTTPQATRRLADTLSIFHNAQKKFVWGQRWNNVTYFMSENAIDFAGIFDVCVFACSFLRGPVSKDFQILRLSFFPAKWPSFAVVASGSLFCKM